MSKRYEETSIGKLVRSSREKAGLTLAGLAKRLANYGFQYSDQGIANWEIGRAKPPLFAKKDHKMLVEALSESLDISTTRLLDAAGMLPTGSRSVSPDAEEMMILFERISPSQQRLVKAMLNEFAAHPA